MRTILIYSSAITLGLSLVLTGCAKQQAERKRLQAELENVKAALEIAKKEQADLKAKMDAAAQGRDAMARQVTELTTERDRLQQALANGQTQLEDLQGRLGEMKDQRDASRQKAEELSALRSVLRQELDTMGKSRDAAAAEAQKAQEQTAELKAQLQAQTKKVLELQEQLAASNAGAGASGAEAIESPTIHSLTTTRPRINAGQSSTLSWRVSNVDRVRIEPDIGTVDALGSRTVTPLKTTTYVLIATNKAGESRVTRRIEVF